MKPVLTNTPIHKLTGWHAGLSGDCSLLSGDCSRLSGDCSDLRGDCSGLRGNCLGLSGNLDAAELTTQDREHGVAIQALMVRS